jgi:type II secretory pathway pseudopilin PulG
MKLRCIQKNKGFTIVELLVAMTIGITLAAVVTGVAVSSMREVRTIKRSERLHSNAVYVTNTLGYLMKQSAGFNLVSPTQITITLPDLTTKTISLSGTTIKLGTDPLTSTDIQVTNFKMLSGANSVRVIFTMKFLNGTELNGTETFSGTTTVARRNTL